MVTILVVYIGLKMKLIKQTIDACLLYSAAMILSVDPKILIDEIGHDGQDIWWPELKGCQQKRGHHIQEIQDCFIRRGKCLYPVELMPTIHTDSKFKPETIFKINNAMERFQIHIAYKTGILIGMNRYNKAHAVAWDGQRIFDPNGMSYGLEDFRIREIWLVGSMI